MLWRRQKEMRLSEIAFDIFYKIIKKYPFIYQIKDKYYLISNNVFQECTLEERKLYEKLLQEYEMLGNDEDIKKIKYSEDIKMLESLADIFNRLKTSGKIIEESSVKCNCKKLSNIMSEDDINSLKKQFKTFCKIADLSEYYNIYEERQKQI